MSEHNPAVGSPSTPLVGDRVLVRPYVEADAPALHDAVVESRLTLQPWMPWANSHANVEVTLDYIKQCGVTFLLGTDFPMGMFLRADGSFLGGTGLHMDRDSVPSFEIGYWVRTSQVGNGYVSEAVRLLTSCAFEQLEAQRVTIHCDARNERSRRVAERQQFVFEGRRRNAVRDTRGELADVLLFSMIPSDYERARRLWP